MINKFEVIETNKMIDDYNLDVRTITLGISLMDCISNDLETLNSNIYNKIKNFVFGNETHRCSQLNSLQMSLLLNWTITV